MSMGSCGASPTWRSADSRSASSACSAGRPSLREFDTALRAVDLHPKLVPEAVKLAARRPARRSERKDRAPEPRSYREAAEIIAYCMTGGDAFAAANGARLAAEVERRIEAALDAGINLDAKLVLLALAREGHPAERRRTILGWKAAIEILRTARRIVARLKPSIGAPNRTPPLPSDPSMPAIISVKNVSKTYASGFEALKNINLDIEKGEIFALLGPNGAGKTTLINIICGIVTAERRQGHDRRPRHRHRLPRGAVLDRARAAGTHHRHVRNGVGDRHLQPWAVGQMATNPTISRAY